MKTNTTHSRAGEPIKVAEVSAPEQSSRIHEAVAQRAFEISKRQNSTTPHELQDWRKAESEVAPPFCFGRMSTDGKLWLGTDSSVFDEGTTEVWVSPRRLSICGKPRMKNAASSEKPYGEKIYHRIELPVRIDPARIAAHFSKPL